MAKPQLIWCRTWNQVENVNNQREARCEEKNTRQDRGYEVSMKWGTEIGLTSVTFGTDRGNWLSARVRLKRSGQIPTAGISPGVSPSQTQTTRHKLSIILFGQRPNLHSGHFFRTLSRETPENYCTARRTWTHDDIFSHSLTKKAVAFIISILSNLWSYHATASGRSA